MGGRSQAHLPPAQSRCMCERTWPCVCMCGLECREDGHFCSYMSCQMCIDLNICLSVCVCVCFCASVCVHVGMCVPGSCMHIYTCEHVRLHVCLCVHEFACVYIMWAFVHQHGVFILYRGPPPVSRVFDCLGCSLLLFFLHSQSPWAIQEDIT